MIWSAMPLMWRHFNVCRQHQWNARRTWSFRQIPTGRHLREIWRNATQRCWVMSWWLMCISLWDLISVAYQHTSTWWLLAALCSTKCSTEAWLKARKSLFQMWNQRHSSICSGGCFPYHDDVIKWKHFPRYWPFVRGIHRSPVNSPHKGQWRGALMYFYLRLKKRLSKQSWGWWFETPSCSLWRHCNVSPYHFDLPPCDRCYMVLTCLTRMHMYRDCTFICISVTLQAPVLIFVLSCNVE